MNKNETIFTLENIWQAYEMCVRRKKKTINRLKLELKKERELINLRDELQSKNYKISRHMYFVVTEPKPREVFAADFRDRIVHHLIYNELSPLAESWFIDDSYANRTGKGTHAGFRKVREYVKQNRKAWYLKLDIFSFFRSIDKQILFNIISEFINLQNKPIWWKNDILWICREIIFHDPTLNYTFRGEKQTQLLIPKQKSLFYSNGSGLPIGNLTSQFFANCYLDGLDKYITKGLNFKNYVRYVDDFIIIDNDKEKLKSIIPVINNWLLNERKIFIHPKKIIIQKVLSGIDFVGYVVKPTHTLVRNSVIKRCKNKARLLKLEKDEKVKDRLKLGIISYLGHFSHANSYRLRNKFKHLTKVNLKSKR